MKKKQIIILAILVITIIILEMSAFAIPPLNWGTRTNGIITVVDSIIFACVLKGYGEYK